MGQAHERTTRPRLPCKWLPRKMWLAILQTPVSLHRWKVPTRERVRRAVVLRQHVRKFCLPREELPRRNGVTVAAEGSAWFATGTSGSSSAQKSASKITFKSSRWKRSAKPNFSNGSVDDLLSAGQKIAPRPNRPRGSLVHSAHSFDGRESTIESTKSTQTVKNLLIAALLILGPVLS